MWLLNALSYELESFEGDQVPPYAILSHRWEHQEVLHQHIQQKLYTRLQGWSKVKRCCREALRDGLTYVWVDTCCIDKKSSAELSEAINSMFLWYKEAAICYAFLSDVSGTIMNSSRANSTTSLAEFKRSQWFTRGWTLQELLAPSEVIFFNRTWNVLGDRSQLAGTIAEITRISKDYLCGKSIKEASIGEKMSWAAGRRTTRVEDRAYSLLGLLDVNMPLLYGERERSFDRLQEEIMKSSNDLSIFAWTTNPSLSSSLLASSPDSFADINSQIHWYTSYFTHDKNGVSGDFAMRRYRWNIDLWGIGFSEKGRIYIPLMRWGSNGRSYRRITLDGEFLTTVPGKLDYQEAVAIHVTYLRITNVEAGIDRYDLTTDLEQTWILHSMLPGVMYSHKPFSPACQRVGTLSNTSWSEHQILWDKSTLNHGQGIGCIIFQEHLDMDDIFSILSFGPNAVGQPVPLWTDIHSKHIRTQNSWNGPLLEAEAYSEVRCIHPFAPAELQSNEGTASKVEEGTMNWPGYADMGWSLFQTFQVLGARASGSPSILWNVHIEQHQIHTKHFRAFIDVPTSAARDMPTILPPRWIKGSNYNNTSPDKWVFTKNEEIGGTPWNIKTAWQNALDFDLRKSERLSDKCCASCCNARRVAKRSSSVSPATPNPDCRLFEADSMTANCSLGPTTHQEHAEG